jgi:hypothetical protein
MSFFTFEEDVLTVLSGQSGLTSGQVQEALRAQYRLKRQQKRTSLLRRLLPRVADALESWVLSLTEQVLVILLSKSWVTVKADYPERQFVVSYRGLMRSTPKGPDTDDMGEPIR